MWSTTFGAPRTRFARAASRRGWPTAWLSACSAAALLAAGCGAAEPEAIPPPTAESLAAQSDAVADALASGDPCRADRLADELVAEAESAPMPAAYRPEVLEASRSLAASVECPPPPPPPPAEEDDDDGSGNGNGNGNGNGKGKGKGKGNKDDD